MANQEHVERLKQGIVSWNTWRAYNSEVIPDLSKADLSKADLYGANLYFANLIEANLSKASLTEADLRYANLHKADFTKASLKEANLTRARVIGANLSETDLIGANLYGANLIGANLSEAQLMRANFTDASLIGANLYGANLIGANLSGSILNDAYFCEATAGETLFTNVDLSTVEELVTIRHLGPSSVSIDTIYRSQGKIPEAFLRGAGVPDSFLEYMHSLVRQPIRYFTCFISHSHHDQRFCDRLYADLRHHDVPSWYFPEDATWGKTVWGEIDRGIKMYDKLVVVCSEHSLPSPAVQREIERALQREDSEGKHILFPLRIDNYLFEQWEHERKADVVSKVAGDFRGWESSAEKYEKSFQKFLKALKTEEETSI